MRVEQEWMVFRYIVTHKPKLKTVMVIGLRMLMLALVMLIVSSFLVSTSLIQFPIFNSLIVCSVLWITARLLWMYGYTIKQLKRFSVWLLVLFMIPFPFYFVLQANNYSLQNQLNVANKSKNSKVGLSSYSFNSIMSSTSVSQVKSFNQGDKKITLSRAQLSPLKMVYRLFAADEEDVDFTNVEAKIVGKPLAYPNPFRASSGTEIGYELSKPLDIEIHVYNMLGHLVAKKIIFENDPDGGTDGWNTVAFGKSDIEGVSFSSGAYFYLIVNDGAVLGKGKLAVTP